MTDETNETPSAAVNAPPATEPAQPPVEGELPAAPPLEGPPLPPMGDGVPPASSTPYRSSPFELSPFAKSGPSRLVTLWAPAFTVFGVVLWSFVVMGQLVTTYAPGRHELLLGEVTGVFFVLTASVAAWVSALRSSLRVSPATGMAKRIERGLAFGILALLGWGAAMIVTLIVGRAMPDGVITFFLMATAAATFIYGRRLLQRNEPKARSVLGMALWAGAGLVTFVALIALGGD